MRSVHVAGCVLILVGAATCGGKVLLDAPDMSASEGAAGGAGGACVHTCARLNACGAQTPDCASRCAVIAEVNSLGHCATIYDDWIACLAVFPGDSVCTGGNECGQDEAWLKCFGNICNMPTAPSGCALGRPCTQNGDCMPSQVCSTLDAGTGTCQYAGTPCLYDIDCEDGFVCRGATGYQYGGCQPTG